MSWLEWYPSGRVQKAMRGTWVQCEVWPNPSKDWTWRVGMGGPHGMAVLGFAATDTQAKDDAERYLRELLLNLIGDGAK